MDSITELVHEASQVVSHYWPMTTFVHHNPIRNLETLPFHEAIQVAQRYIGGQGYLSNAMYREQVKQGRIQLEQIDEALQKINQNKVVSIGQQKLSQLQVLRVQLLEGLEAPGPEMILAQIKRSSNSKIIHHLAKQLEINDQLDLTKKNISLSQYCDQEFNTQLVSKINNELTRWCESFLDEGYATWSMPKRELGFYAAWKSLAAEEWSSCGIANSSDKIKSLPQSAEDALSEHLEQLGIPEESKKDYLAFQLTSLYGWASFINWRSESNDYQWQASHPIDLIQYLAVRLFYERELVNQVSQDKLGLKGSFDNFASLLQNKSPHDLDMERLRAAWSLNKLASISQISGDELLEASSDQLQEVLSWLEDFPEGQHGPIWLQASEASYQQGLINKLRLVSSTVKLETAENNRALAQMMFCIDVRSEPFRRNLEAFGNYQTIGFAGFFGLAISSCAHGQQHETDQCPAIVQAQYKVHELIREDQETNHVRHKSYKDLLSMLNEIFNDLKYQILSPYIMVESLGWLFGLQILERTIFPGTYYKWRRALEKSIAPKPATKMTMNKDELGRGLTEDQQSTSIETALRTMGLVNNFARLVVVAGHTSMSDNNPYEAALNCGACGGNSGEPNARLFASIANKKEVRNKLAQNGITIPEDTHFIAAVHNTTTDDIDFYDLEDLPKTHLDDLEKLKLDLKQAAIKTNQERCKRLPGVNKDLLAKAAVKEIKRRSADWSETRPEWGLSGNAAFIIGRRSLTQELNLEGRSFLNSHDYRLDPDGSLLEGILMGPMIVGQWINAEHYFSATDPEVYGSGSKVYHNVVGRIAIMSGPQSDLRTGLALQSVADGTQIYHEPLRLFVVIEAPCERIAKIIERQPVLKQLCCNEWIHLMAVDHDTEKKLYRYHDEQGWLALE